MEPAGPASPVTIAIEDPATADALWCIEQYFLELARRFDLGFDPSRTAHVPPGDLGPPDGALYLARAGGAPIGCGGVKATGEGIGEIKRVWVAREFRGQGVGRRLLRALEAHAPELGVGVVRLDTNRSLVEAQGLYRAEGYVEIPRFNAEPYAHHWFEKRLSSRA